jgi:large repetitive protein
VYTPALDYNGPDSFTFIVSDCLGSSEPALVEIEVTPVNDPPVADPQSVSTPEDTPVDILLTGSDPDGDPITFTVVSTPTHGMLGGTAPDLVYTPTLNYNGPDSFTFIVSDDLESSEPAVVEIEVTPVNDPPVADPQSVSTPEDTPVDILLTGSDPDGDPLTFTVVSIPTYGILGGIAPSLVYTPNLDYNGPDSFTFFVSDGLESSQPALVEIEVTPVNDPPALNAIGDQAAMVGDLLTFTASASDVDGDTLTFSLDPGAPEGAAIDAVSGVFTWMPAASGVFTATIRVRDGGSPVLEDAETINIIVTAQPNFPIYLPVLIRP